MPILPVTLRQVTACVAIPHNNQPRERRACNTGLCCNSAARTVREQAPHPAVGFALTSFPSWNERRSISEVTTQLGMSPKRFISLFEEAVGLTRDPCSAGCGAFRRYCSGPPQGNLSGGRTLRLPADYARPGPFHS
jgi:hypothetical protein